MLTRPRPRNTGTNTAITTSSASGRASSYCSQISPPPGTRATKAGMPMKELADDCVAIVDSPSAHHGSRREATW